MSTVIRWLHLSDFHFNPDQGYDANIVLEALLRSLASIENDEFFPLDLVFITGDIAFSGRQEEYDLAAKFFDKLLPKFSIAKDRLYVVPGNHDVDRKRIGIATAIDAYLGVQGPSSSEMRARVAKLLSDPDGRALMLRRLAGYSDFINGYFAGHLCFSDKEFYYSKRVKMGDAELAVYGLNSAWFCSSESDQNHLVIGERQVRDAIAQNTDATLRIALVHHPFDWLADFDRNDSEDILVQNCDFILHGHRHKQAFRQEIRPSGEPYIFASGPGYDRRTLPNACNLVRIDLDSGQGLALSLRYSDEGGGFWSYDTQSDPGLKRGIYEFDRGHPFVSKVSAATPVPEAKALLASPFDYTEYIKKTGRLYEISTDDLLEIAILSPADTVSLLVWLVAQNSSFVKNLIARTGSKLEQALSISPSDLNKFVDLRNELVHANEIATEVKSKKITLLALGVPGGEISQQIALQIPRKDPSQPLRAEQLTFSIYLANQPSESIENPKISLSTTAPFLSYQYRGGGFAIEPSEYWRVSKPNAGSVQCLFSLAQDGGKDFSDLKNPVIGTVKMLIPWGEADNGPIDLNFVYQIEGDNFETVRGEFRIRIISALTFDTAVEAKEFNVPANKQEGIDTGLYIYKGQVLRFATRGVVSLDSRHHFVNADGYMCDELGRLRQPMPGVFEQYTSPGELLKGERPGVLLGWLGDWKHGIAFYVGSTNTIVAESDGNLHLAVNDLLNAYEDNSGTFTVVVHVETCLLS